MAKSKSKNKGSAGTSTGTSKSTANSAGSRTRGTPKSAVSQKNKTKHSKPKTIAAAASASQKKSKSRKKKAPSLSPGAAKAASLSSRFGPIRFPFATDEPKSKAKTTTTTTTSPVVVGSKKGKKASKVTPSTKNHSMLASQGTKRRSISSATTSLKRTTSMSSTSSSKRSSNSNNNYTNTNNYDNNPSRKRPRFQLKMPSASQTHSYESMPWCQCTDEYVVPVPHSTNTTTTTTPSTVCVDDGDSDFNVNDKEQQRQQYVLPTDFFHDGALNSLSKELECFAAYVRLRPQEHSARQAMIQCITDLAGDLFAKKKNNNSNNNNGKQHQQQQLSATSDKNENDNDNADDRIELQCFGSYATPQVCAFSSDVDLALWGVMESQTTTTVAVTPQRLNTITTTFPPLLSSTKTTTTIKSKSSFYSPDECQRLMEEERRQSKLNKWRNVLEDAAGQSRTERADDDDKDRDYVDNYHVEREEEMKQESMSNKKKQKSMPSQVDVDVKTKSHQNDNDDTSLKKIATETTKTKTVASHNVVEFEFDRQSAMELGAADLFVIDRDGDMSDNQEDHDNHDDDEKQMEEKQNNNIQNGSIETKVTEQTAKNNQNDSNKINADKDDEDVVENNYRDNNDDSTQDSADKLENFSGKKSSAASVSQSFHENDHDDDYIEDDDDSSFEPPRKRRKHADQELDPSHTMEVSFHATVLATKSSTSTITTTTATTAPSFNSGGVQGVTGDARKIVLRALQKLGGLLRRQRVVSTVEVRRFAKVPIINMETQLGFEADVAIGGQNGADTSLFAIEQVERYKSFATVVLFLKILLNQQDLDKPFTGGLGSFKLYVILAHHIDKHLSMGGKDEPGEVLASFLYRFGDVRSTKVSPACLTSLDKNGCIKCHDGTMADMNPCHLREHFVELFHTSWQRLSKRLSTHKKSSSSSSSSTTSYLADLIRHQSLSIQRQETLFRASNTRFLGPSFRNLVPSSSSSRPQGDHSRSTLHTAQRRESIRFNIGGASDSRQQNPNNNGVRVDRGGGNDYGRGMQDDMIRFEPAKSSNSTTKAVGGGVVGNNVPGDAEEEDYLRGYGVRRDYNGNLIPRRVQEQQSKFDQMVGKVTKNRSSKKKQHRDKGLQSIAKLFRG